MGVVKRAISFENIDGEETTEEWYFSLGKKDVMDMELAHRADVQDFLKQIVKNRDGRELLKLWRELLFRAVGERQGNLLMKSDEIRQRFEFGGAYEQFLTELVEDLEAGAQFFISIMPSDVQAKAVEEATRTYSKEKLLGMSDEEFARIAGKDFMDMSKEHQIIAFQRANGKNSNPAAAV